MKRLILIWIAALCTCSPELLFSQASIYQSTNGLSTSYNNSDPVPLVGNMTLPMPPLLSMYNFVDGEKYKIVMYTLGNSLAQNLDMEIGNIVRGSADEFTWHTGDQFRASYRINPGTSIGLSETLVFEIYRKRAPAIWDMQTMFFFNLLTTCMAYGILDQGINSGFPILAGDYEVSNTLTVSTTAYPNGGVIEFDAGESVILLPGFKSDLTSEGSILVIHDGCGGSYRPGVITGIHEETKAGNDVLKIYPNPVQSQLTVALPKIISNEEVSIKIRDVNGRLMYSENKPGNQNVQIDMDKFEAGFYVISIAGNGVNHSQKLIKSN